MGLKTANEKLPKHEINRVIDIDLSAFTGGDDKVSFRGWIATDFKPDAKATARLAKTIERLDAENPGANLAERMDAEMRAQLLLLGACYVPSDDEQGIFPAGVLAEWCITAPSTYWHIVSTYLTEFPIGVPAAAAAAKNE